MSAKDLYEQDFFEWTRCNAALLRAGRFDQADIAHIAEEIEDMGRSESRELESRLSLLLMHLLKWQIQPERRGRSWRATIDVQRKELLRLLRRMPSLKPQLSVELSEIYELAVKRAIAETDLPDEDFPAECPYAIDQILAEDFYPE
jgi:hypothetical protein